MNIVEKSEQQYRSETETDTAKYQQARSTQLQEMNERQEYQDLASGQRKRYVKDRGKTMDGQHTLELMPLVQERLVVLTGGRDRCGRPVLSFPASPRTERAKPEDYRHLLQYLMSIPNNGTKTLGFTVLVDMRSATWSTVKPILKALHEYLPPGAVHQALIVKRIIFGRSRERR
ncbi:hypothetical protein Trydic_g23816 [Trypoxylus dichotomus]